MYYGMHCCVLSFQILLAMVSILKSVLSHYAMSGAGKTFNKLYDRLNPSESSAIFRSNVPLSVVFVCASWLTVGMVFYKFTHDWTFYDSYFYVIDAGMSIGFGNIAEMDDDRIHLFTIFLILSGSTIVSGSVGYFLTYIIFENNLVEPEKHKFDSVPFTNDNGQITILSVLLSLWNRFKYSIGWYSKHRSFLKSVNIFVLWMLLGVAYGMSFEGWSFITSLYFAVSACSTGGLLGPPCRNPETTATQYCNLGMARAALSGTYTMLGVPSNILLFANRLFPQFNFILS